MTLLLLYSVLTGSKKELQNQASEWETKAKLNDSAAIPLKYEVERVQKELDALSSHTKWLEEELSNRSVDLTKCKAAHSEQLQMLRQELDQAVMERDESVSAENRLTLSQKNLEAKVDQLSRDLRDSRQEATTANETAEGELQAERKVMALQTEQLERAKSRNHRLERELEGLREIATKASQATDLELNKLRAEVEAECNKVLEQQEIVFKEETERLKSQLVNRETGLLSSPSRTRPLLTSGDEPIGLTDLYVRLNQTEDELQKERSEGKKLKLYMQRVEAEISAKTPVMMRQRKEYEETLERQEEMQNRLRDSLQEAKLYREEALELRDEMSRLQRRNDELQGESKELAKQVRTLLTSKAGGDVPEGSPTSVAEVQEQNQMLLGEHRRLLTQIEDMKLKLQDDAKTVRLEKAEQELDIIQDQQKRQETLVASIVQQRDLYRALLSKQEGAPANLAGTELVVAQHSHDARAAEERCKALEQELAKSTADMTVMKGDRDAMLERVERYTVYSNELTVSIEKFQHELTKSNAAAARNKADSDYHREKCTRAEKNAEESRETLQRIQESKKEVQKLNSELHQQTAIANAAVARCENDVRQAEMKLRLAETQSATAKASENRLAGEVSQLRTELARQGSLLDSVQKIEASLSAKSGEEKVKLKEEVDRVTQQLEQARSKQGVDSENLVSRVKELEALSKESELKKEAAMKESLAAKEETLAATTERQKLVAKVERLESELSSAQKKLGTSVDPEEVSLQTKVESLTQQLEEAKAEATALKERTKNFEGVAKASEKELTSLTQASGDFKKGKTKEIDELVRRIEDIKEESKKKDEILAKFTADLFSQRGEQEKSEGLLKEKIAGMEGQVKSAKEDADAAVARANALMSEMEKYRSDASKAQSNYERELDLHSGANRDLRAAREEIATEQRLRRTAEEELESVKVEIAGQQEQLQEDKKKMETNMKEVEESLKQSRAQNDLLLSQVSALGDQIEKAQSERLESASGGDDSTGEGDDLRKTISDLREVVKFMRSERELVEAQLDAARRTAEREKAASTATKRSLDEARAELKILHETKSIDDSTTAIATKEKLKNAEAQLNLLQDSNKLLREESVKLQDTIATVVAKLAVEQRSVAPLEQKQKELSVEKAALVAEKESLQREVDAWKNRVQSLVSKFNQIDPEEHSKVVKEVGVLKKNCSELQKLKEAAEKEGTNANALLTKVNRDLTQQKALVQKQQSLLKKMKVDKESASKSSTTTAVVTTERDALKETLKKKEVELVSTKVEVKGANDRIENLKNRLRQFQKTISEQRRKLVSMESAAAVAPAPAPVAETKTPAFAPAAQKVTDTAKPSQPTLNESTNEKSSAIEGTTEKEQSKISDKATPNVSVQTGFSGVPAGGFKFGASSVQPNKAAPTTSGNAPPLTSAKVVEKKTESKNLQNPTPASKTAAVSPPLSVPPAKKAKTGEQKEDTPTKQDAGDTEGKAAQALKDKLMNLKQRQMDAQNLKEKLRKRKFDKSQADQQAQKKVAGEAAEQNQESKADAKVEQTVPKKADQAEAATKVADGKDAAIPPVAVKKAEPVVSVKKAEPVVAMKKAEPVVAMKKTEKAAVEAKNPEDTAASKAPQKKETKEEAPKASTFGSSPFGGATFGSGTATFGSTSFGKAPTGTATGFGKPSSGSGLVFGQSSSIGGFGSAAPAKREAAGSSSSTFLDMKPPSSSAAPFSFGSSTIKLPTPNVAPPPAGPSPFGAFVGNPFGGGAPAPSTAKPLFGSSASIKRSAPEDVTDEQGSKQARVEEAKAPPKQGE